MRLRFRIARSDLAQVEPRGCVRGSANICVLSGLSRWDSRINWFPVAVAIDGLACGSLATNRDEEIGGD